MSKEVEWLRRMKHAQAVEMPVENPVGSRKAAPCGPIEPDSPEPQNDKAGKGFSQVAGMDNLKSLVQEGFINVLKNPALAARYSVSVPNLLLYGPAGCGKTFFAERIAEEVGINFMKVSPDDLSCIYVHGTQQKIGELFRKAEQNAPTLMFLDEFDCMVPKRSGDANHQYQTDEVDEFLTMLGDTASRGIYVVAATNHPENIDSCILRTGRIDEKIYVPMPDRETRESLFRLELKSRPAAEDIDYSSLSAQTEGFNCSDISYIVKTAARQKFNAAIQSSAEELIGQQDLEGIISDMVPSVNEKDLRAMEDVHRMFASRSQRQAKRIGFM